jgi:hypothetical protein
MIQNRHQRRQVHAVYGVEEAGYERRIQTVERRRQIWRSEDRC